MDGPQVLAERRTSPGSRVTVVVSLCNFRDFLVSCLDSVAAQTLPAFDLVVVDDCSLDGGAIRASQWLDDKGDRFANYLLTRHAQSRGLAAARNTGFEAARSDYVFVLDGDNLIYPRCLQQLAAALDHSDASFSFCQLERFGAEVGLDNIYPWQPARLHLGNTIDAMVMLRRRTWQQVGGYSMDMPASGWEDFDLWFKIARVKGWGVQVPEVLGRCRAHMNSLNRTVSNPHAKELWQYLREQHPDAFPASDRAFNSPQG